MVKKSKQQVSRKKLQIINQEKIETQVFSRCFPTHKPEIARTNAHGMQNIIYLIYHNIWQVYNENKC